MGLGFGVAVSELREAARDTPMRLPLTGPPCHSPHRPRLVNHRSPGLPQQPPAWGPHLPWAPPASPSSHSLTSEQPAIKQDGEAPPCQRGRPSALGVKFKRHI